MSDRKSAAKRGGAIAVGVTRGIFGVIGRFIATIIMVGVITGCIVACVLTVYILQYIETDDDVELEEYTLGLTSIMYYYDKDGKPQELQRMYISESNRIWVDLNRIPKHTQDALVAIEDKRFYDHQGVDWRRTIAAFIDQFMPLSGTTAGGGSTIPQQLIKNITGDKEVRIDRKVREIFRALDLSKRYSKEQIIEAYLNVVPFGNGTNGIEAAANSYFGKSAIDLTISESAAIVGITKYPTLYNPFLNPEENKERQEYILQEMRDQGFITQEEYDKAIKEKLNFKTVENKQNIEMVWSYFTDYVVNQVINDLMEKKNYTKTKATKEFYEGGYRIYTTVDMEIQSWLEEVYLNTDMFPPVRNADYPQSECVITDINGKILGMVGGIGKKEESRILNRATDSLRQPGSSLKPLATYALAIDNNRVTWSTMVDDNPINRAAPGEPPKLWPTNYYNRYLGPMTIDNAIYNSVNTVAVKTMGVVTPQAAFNFLKNDLDFHSLIEREVINGSVHSDIDLAPMAIGALTKGVTPLEMAGGYQIFANGGTFTSPYAYTKVEDSTGKIILETDTTPRQVIGEDSSVVLNKLLQNAAKPGLGTGSSANLGNIMPVAGKTGTTEYDIDQWFVGITPYYVCQVWLGYDMPLEMKVNPATGTRQPVRNTILYNQYGPPMLWKTIMQPLSEKQEYKPFIESNDVVSMTYCRSSGNLATGSCPSVGSGWYKKSRIPPSCSGNHAVASTSPDSSTESGDKPAASENPAAEKPAAAAD